MARLLLAAGAALAAVAALEFDPVISRVMTAVNASLAANPDVTKFPANGVAGQYGWTYSAYNGWTSGFYPGLVWKLYNVTSTLTPDPSASWWLSNAIARTWPIAPEAADKGTHDVGFMVYTSFGAQYHLTGNTTARAIALQAADSLSTRFVPLVGAIRSWGSPNAQHTMEVIADNMMNLELLWWAGTETGNSTYWSIANSHSKKMISDLYQPFNPGCAWHLITYNDQTGAIISRSSTPQGLGLNTVWSRGQAWTINGFAIAYRFTKDPAYLAQAQAASDCFIRLVTACCANDQFRWMPLWDFFVTAPNNTVDVSAAMIAASGMIEMSWYLPPSTRTPYLTFAYRLVTSALGFWSFNANENDAVLANSTVTFPLTGISLIYADYYLTEAWLRWNATPAAWRDAAMAAM